MADSVLPGTYSIPKMVNAREYLNPADIAFRALVHEDLAIYGGDLLSQGSWSLLWHRFGNWRMSVKPGLLRGPQSLIYRSMFQACTWLCRILLTYAPILGRRVRLEPFGGMVPVPAPIGSDMTVRQNTTMKVASKRARASRSVIPDHVDIVAGAVIVGKIPIGRGAIIGTNSVVAKSALSNAVAVGVPGRVIRYLGQAEIGALAGAPNDAAEMR